MRAHDEPLPRSRALRLVGTGAAAAAALIWVIYLVQPPGPAGATLDQSWRVALTMAAHDHLQFGRDIVFTFGPLGYVLMGSPDPALAVGSVAISVLVAALTALGIGLVLRGRSGLLQKLALGGVMLAVSTLSGFDYIALAGVIALLARGSRFPRLAPLVGGSVGVVALFGVLSKFTLGFDVLAAAGAVWIVDLVTGPKRRRRAALVAGGIALAVTAVGLAASMRFSGPAIVAYLRGAAEISSGYSTAMAISGPYREVALAALVGAAVLGAGAAAWRERKPGLFALAAVTLFLAWKHGFVRQDGHVLVYFMTAPVLAAVLAVSLRRVRAVAFALAVTALSFGALLYAYGRYADVPPLFSMDRLARDAEYLVAPVATQARNAQAQAVTLAADRLPPDLLSRVNASTVDVLPSETALVAVNGLRWDPLPVFQSYSAYTPALDRLNRDALIARGAATIFYEYAAIDGRLPLGEAPATTTELVCRYRAEPSNVTIGPRRYLILHRLAGAACDASPAGAARDVAVGRPIAVPAPRSPDEFVVASFMLRPTLATKLRTAVARGTQVWMDVTFADASVQRYRLVTETLGDGVIVSPTPRELGEAGTFFASGQLAPVRSVTLIAPPGAYVLDGVTFVRERRRAPNRPRPSGGR